MHYVVRRTMNPAADLERSWSAWGGEYAEHPLMLSIDEFVDHLDVSYDDDASEVAEIINDETSLTIARCPVTGLWASVHHDGLSSYELSSQTLDDAIVEAGAARHTYMTGGCCAVEPLSYHHVRDDIYVFTCNSICAQHDS